MVAVDDLIDAAGVAHMLGLKHRNSVATYAHRYTDFPRPVVDTGSGRCRLWTRPEIESWIDSHRTARRGRTT